MVSLPNELLRRIDSAAVQRGTSRSGWLAEAARRELSRRDPSAIREAIERSEKRFANIRALDAAEVIRLDRDERDRRDRSR
jgi:metal-responsive CopG/Arc/MetJ family transcriptional regulator